MATIDAAYFSSLSAQLNEVYFDVEREKNAFIPTSVRSLIENLILESVSMREAEWMDRYDINVNRPESLSQTIQVAAESTSQLLRETEVDEIDGRNYVTLIETINAVRIKWCGIFPFCRRR